MKTPIKSYAQNLLGVLAIALSFNMALYAGSFEELAGNLPPMPENALTVPMPQSPSITPGNRADLPDLGSKLFIPRQNIVSDPDAIIEIPLRNPSAFESNKTAFTDEVNDMVTEILEDNAQKKPYAKAYEKMSSAWNKGIMIRSQKRGYDFTYCINHPNVIAFAIAGERNIYMCRLLIEEMDSQDTAQTLIHETAHVVGYTNECDVTKLELTAMEKSGLTPYRNGYADRCGL